jgi:hypothetical protein
VEGGGGGGGVGGVLGKGTNRTSLHKSGGSSVCAGRHPRISASARASRCARIAVT